MPLLILVIVSNLTLAAVTTSVTVSSSGAITPAVTAGFPAASGSPADIQAAVNSAAAAGGGTVYIPAGEFVFTITSSKKGIDGNPTGVTIPGGVNVVGAGEGVTILRQTTVPPASASMFCVDGRNGKQVRISGISFEGIMTGTDSGSSAGVRMMSATDYRVDHCSFNDFTSAGIYVSNQLQTGANRGVIDHCDFDDEYKDLYPSSIWGYGIIVIGTYHNWEDLTTFLGKYDGVNNIAYIEDCTFTRTRHAIASNGGGYYVARYNRFIDPRPYGAVDIHANSGSGSEDIGGRGCEAYANTFDATGSPTSRTIAFQLRGGGGVIFNNTIINHLEGVTLQNDGMSPDKCLVQDFYIWGNTYTNVQTQLYNEGGYVEDVDYFLFQLSGYTPYTYPHPATIVP